MADLNATRSWCPERITGLLMRCGRYALERWRSSAWHLKGDGSLVTAVDQAVERMLIDELESVPEGVRIIAEESVAGHDEGYVSAALAGNAYIVDPIDGTAPFAHGIAYWGVSVGWLEQGRLTHGGIVLPATGELFVTAGDRVLWSDCADFASGNPGDLRPLEPRLAPFGPGCMVGLGQRFVRTCGFPWKNPTIASGCAIQGLAYVMLGRLSSYIGYMKLWDLAAVLPMLLRCGIEVRLVNGTAVTAEVRPEVFDLAPGSPTRWSLRDECLFAPPETLSRLYPAIRGCLGRGE